MSKYLFLDTETGGIGLDKSLLSVGYIITDDKFNGLFHENVLVKPDNGIYTVEGEALGINGIDLVKHTSIAKTYKTATTDLYNLLFNYSAGGRDKLTVFGKNIYFDLTHVWDKLLKRATWEQFCSYQTVDLTSVWKFLEITGKVPVLPKTSLSNIADFLEIDRSLFDLHTSMDDAILTMQCFKIIAEKFQ